MARPPSPILLALREIRDELRTTREELSKRIDQTNERIDQTNTGMGVLAGTMRDLAEQQRFVVAHLRADSRRDRRFEAELAEIRVRLGVLETRADSEE